jgi:polysaccharide deacetylase family protein (PEP-CTERM system associated)
MAMNATGTKYFLITIDVEDWFQVENFKPWIPLSTWDSRELRVERNVNRLLDLFDAVTLKPSEPSTCHSPLNTISRSVENDGQDSRCQEDNNIEPTPIYNKLRTTDDRHARKVQATFFILGWIAERLPSLVREIRSRGHEVASHGYNHDLPSKISGEELQRDLIKSKKVLSDITGNPVYGYRSPSFAVSDEILKTIQDSGFRYDSSYNSFSRHGRYGQISLNGYGRKGIAHKLSDNFYEIPISNLMISRQILPWGGGGYFRLTPYRLFRLGVQRILKMDGAYLFYVHPWEIDPDQPKVNSASFNCKLRHYTNLNKAKIRLKRLIENFSQHRFVTCSEYLILTEGCGLQD